jgi:hypothetical protein
VGLYILLEINGAYPSGSYIIAFIQCVDITFCTSVNKYIASAKPVKQTSSFPTSDKITGLTVLYQTPGCSTQGK